MQLLQAKGWYGVFGRITGGGATERDDGSVVENYGLSIELRPLVGWSSAEGGFQPLFYDPHVSRLVTATKVETEPGVFHLGDACVEEVSEVRAMLVLSIIRKAQALRDRYSSGLSELALHESARTLLEHHKIPFVEEGR